ncbi:hypothetical protein [Chryseobacterium sp. JV274]|uniref:hypothetical protein n=1 Tax=Chryseobacterium sp. JV274 TaxID=1932669 RepID=UPI0015C2895D|nr:hypothetical protein [Chryseobacterium sp. JV274]CAD0224633.1 membrane protein of unknown function [Chryseobacterium sp. JV274]
MENKRRDWKLLGNFLYERFNEAWKAPSYVLYFFVVIVLVGTFGVITELFSIDFCLSCKFDHSKVTNSCFNISSTGLALVTASVIELIFISRKNIGKETKNFNLNFEELENLKKGVRMFGLSALIISFILWILINYLFEIDLLKIFFSTILLLFAYFVWWVSNVRNKILSNYIKNYESIMGGDANTSELNTAEAKDKQESNLNGNLENFKT